MDQDRGGDAGRGEQCGPPPVGDRLAQHHGEVGARNDGIDAEGQHESGKFEPGKFHRCTAALSRYVVTPGRHSRQCREEKSAYSEAISWAGSRTDGSCLSRLRAPLSTCSRKLRQKLVLSPAWL